MFVNASKVKFPIGYTEENKKNYFNCVKGEHKTFNLLYKDILEKYEEVFNKK